MRSKASFSSFPGYPRLAGAKDSDGVAADYPKPEESNSWRAPTVMLTSESRQSYLFLFLLEILWISLFRIFVTKHEKTKVLVKTKDQQTMA